MLKFVGHRPWIGAMLSALITAGLVLLRVEVNHVSIVLWTTGVVFGLCVILPLCLATKESSWRTAGAFLTSCVAYPVAHKFAADFFVGWNASDFVLATALAGAFGGVALALPLRLGRTRAWQSVTEVGFVGGLAGALMGLLFVGFPTMPTHTELRYIFGLAVWQGAVAWAISPRGVTPFEARPMREPT